MASEDVIELDSSDDEAEPVPKKKKPMLDAMVHIPSKLPGITIKPTKCTSSPSRGVTGNPIVLNKTNLKINSAITRTKPITAVKLPIHHRIIRNDVKLKNAALVQNKVSINPLSIAQSLRKTQVVIKKVPQNNRVRNTIQIKGPKMLNALPPSITIKPIHNSDVTISPIQKAGTSGLHKRRGVVGPKRKLPEMMTVEIDDEDTSESATTGPQWYLRPEDQTKKEKSVKLDNDIESMEIDSVQPSMEEKNNKEPDTTKYVEITIEDSPLKSIHSNHPDIGKELTITIEDSPVKPIAKAKKDVESDSEMNVVMEDKQSKKKLDYPKASEISAENQVVEIEIDLQDTRSVVETEIKSTSTSPKCEGTEVIAKSSKNKSDTVKVIDSKKDDIEQAKELIIEDGEFHPIYHKFINMCFQLENTDDMKKIVEKKIKAYYKQCSKDYVESEEFIDMVSSKIVSMKASPEKMYLYIKDIVDELNLQRKMTKSVTKSVSKNIIDTEKESIDVKYEASLYDSKKCRQIRKLEKTIKKLHRAIQKLEEQEVDFDDDEDSVYLLTERYKERMVRVHAKFCQLTNTKMPSEPRIHVEARPGRPTGPAKRLEKWVNRKVPIGTPLPFPDFHDVLRCVRDANEEDKLGLNDIDVMEEARDLFTRCGKKLQRRRQENEWRIAASRIAAEVDPAENDTDLKRMLDENKIVAAKKETELFNKYADRQYTLKLEAEEIGDKEAEESPLESEEDEDVVENDNSLEDKQKRKERLKRLLKEKSKKDEEKENVVTKDSGQKENNETNKKESKDNIQDIDDEKTIKDKSYNVETIAESMTNETETVKDKDESNTLKENKEDENNDSDKVESDIDELHLLQKLHSENEANTSSLESSDSDTPIFDTLESDSEVETGTKLCDVISIENSSYSESETIVDGSTKDSHDDPNFINRQRVEALVTANFEIEYSSTGIEETNKEAPPEKNTLIEETEENILLASSDEEAKDKAGSKKIEDTCINLRDDNISISDTIIDGGTVEEENLFNDENSIPENNNAVDIVGGRPSEEDNDNTKKKDSSELAESMDITESSGSEQSNNAVEIVEESPTDDDNYVNDNTNKKDSSEHAESMDITESSGSEQTEITKEIAESNTENKINTIEKENNEQSAIIETSNCETNMEV